MLLVKRKKKKKPESRFMERGGGGPINPYTTFLEDHFDAEWFHNHGSMNFVEEEEERGNFLMPRFDFEDNKMPFLQMLQGVEIEYPPGFCSKDPTFQSFLRFQHLKSPFLESKIHAMELESCITHELLHSPVKSEAGNVLNRFSAPCFEGVSSESIQEKSNSGGGDGNSRSPPPEIRVSENTQLPKSAAVGRKKRKRTRPMKNKEEVETQRMTHIAVERNRRRQMNDHLNCLRELMPPSYIQRGDQASIIGGAIDFVKELEQLLQSLEAQKRMRRSELEQSISKNNSTPNSSMEILNPQNYEAFEAKNKAGAVSVEVNVIQNHVNMKIQCPRRSGQLLQAIITLEGLRLTVLHLNVTSSESSVLYSFNLKMEDDCKLKSAEEVEATVHQIFI